MRTERQKQAARANGAKSRGPITPEGKLASSRNAMTHGLLAGTVVLKGESEERFNALLADLHAELQPQTAVEITLVETMAAARWRQLRIWGIEKATMEHQMRIEDDPEEDPATRCARAFRTLGDNSRALELINRYDARYERQYLRAHRRFLELVDRRTPPPAPAAVQAPQEVIPDPHVAPQADNLQNPPDTIAAKQTRQPLTLIPSTRLAAAACAIILSAISLIPSAADVSRKIVERAQPDASRSENSRHASPSAESEQFGKIHALPVVHQPPR